MHFRSHVKPRKRSRSRWRLWMLVIALGLVLASMRQLGQPRTARRLEQLFTSPRLTAPPPALESLTPNFDIPMRQAPVQEVGPPGEETEEEVAGLAQVKDKTYFRPAEREAWFSLFGKLQQIDDRQLWMETRGEVSYAQFLHQPEVYRGRLVTIVGKVLREELEQPAKNQLGIDSYHRLWIQPQGGGHWPMVVYCLNLPAEFPRGENLAAPVSITGFFFKNWSYAYEEGLGLAPVLLADHFSWQPPAAIPQSKPITPRNWIVAATLACVFAVITTWLAIRNTRRRRYTPRAPQQFRELANRESEA